MSLLKQRLYKNRSFSGKVDIDANMLVNIISGNVNYIPDTAFDVAFVDIFDKSKYLEITGATIVQVSFFSDYEINTANYISNTTNYITTIPSNAVMATITLRKTDNTDGYNNLRVNQNGAAPSSLRLLQNTGELFTEKSLFFNRSGNPKTTTEYLTTTGFLPITGKDDIVVKGANNASVPAITFWDAHYKSLRLLLKLNKQQTGFIRLRRLIFRRAQNIFDAHATRMKIRTQRIVILSGSILRLCFRCVKTLSRNLSK